jgi:hypothetical protein
MLEPALEHEQADKNKDLLFSPPSSQNKGCPKLGKLKGRTRQTRSEHAVLGSFGALCSKCGQRGEGGNGIHGVEGWGEENTRL